mmetsp:Transcript_9743/g.18358  ORF Transcript_9743/g.18358 Transcript_9743/m.18358 type:complete len:358 (-) Transcript_9743:627-1700(-)
MCHSVISAAVAARIQHGTICILTSPSDSCSLSLLTWQMLVARVVRNCTYVHRRPRPKCCAMTMIKSFGMSCPPLPSPTQKCARAAVDWASGGPSQSEAGPRLAASAFGSDQGAPRLLSTLIHGLPLSAPCRVAGGHGSMRPGLSPGNLISLFFFFTNDSLRPWVAELRMAVGGQWTVVKRQPMRTNIDRQHVGTCLCHHNATIWGFHPRPFLGCHGVGSAQVVLVHFWSQPWSCWRMIWQRTTVRDTLVPAECHVPAACFMKRCPFCSPQLPQFTFSLSPEFCCRHLWAYVKSICPVSLPDTCSQPPHPPLRHAPHAPPPPHPRASAFDPCLLLLLPPALPAPDPPSFPTIPKPDGS